MKDPADSPLRGDAARRYVEQHHPYSWEEMTAFPRYIDIEPINSCNARCTMCGIDFDRRPLRRMRDELFDRIVAELALHRDEIERVGLFINSEPLMDRRLAEKVAKLKAAGIRRTFLTTNASLLSTPRAEELLRAGLDVAYLSIDSLDPTTYERIRIGLSFDTVYRNAREFLRLRDRIRPQTVVRITMVQLESSTPSEEFIEHWRPLLAPRDQIVVTRGYNWGTAQDVIAKEEGRRHNLSPCLGLWTSLSIDVEGDVRMCCADEAGTTRLGDLNHQTIEEVWQGAELARIRQVHLDGRRREIALCDGCPIWTPQKHIAKVVLEPPPERSACERRLR